jgi:very-short-patch-repair endonuclease
MSLRFPSIEAMEAALGRKVRVRDSFSESAPPAMPAMHEAPAKPRRATGVAPHDILWAAVVSSFGDGAVREFENAVPGRKYRLDIAIPASKLAIEVDGWQWHGKHKGDFTRDRERQNLLTLHGWRILRFTAGQIRKDTAGCVSTITSALSGSPT